jgi:hypothetical protein
LESQPYSLGKVQEKEHSLVPAVQTKYGPFVQPYKVEFLDKKHIVNKDAIPSKGRADSLNGYVSYIPFTGDFWERYNIFAVISGNPAKCHPVEY